jgi:hypothetical protein
MYEKGQVKWVTERIKIESYEYTHIFQMQICILQCYLCNLLQITKQFLP